jgi:hypothetical protein
MDPIAKPLEFFLQKMEVGRNTPTIICSLHVVVEKVFMESTPILLSFFNPNF